MILLPDCGTARMDPFAAQPSVVVFCDVQALRANELGVNNTRGLLFLAGLWGFAFVVYWASKLYRRSRGESTSDAYKELPIE